MLNLVTEDVQLAKVLQFTHCDKTSLLIHIDFQKTSICKEPTIPFVGRKRKIYSRI